MRIDQAGNQEPWVFPYLRIRRSGPTLSGRFRVIGCCGMDLRFHSRRDALHYIHSLAVLAVMKAMVPTVPTCTR